MWQASNRDRVFSKSASDRPSRSLNRLERRHVKAMLEARAATPSAANHFIELIGALMRAKEAFAKLGKIGK